MGLSSLTHENDPIQTMNRRYFIELAMLATANLATAAEPAGRQKGANTPLRRMITITYNVYAFNGYPKTDDTRPILEAVRPQMPSRFAQELAIQRPDIVTFQESPPESDVRLVAEALGMHYVYFPGGFPGTLLTRYPIVASQNCPLVERRERGDLFSRHWGKAVLDAGGQKIRIYSAHLHPSNEAIRAQEVEEVLNVIRADGGNGSDFILQGDLNHEPIEGEYPRWVEAGLTDCYVAKGVEQRNTIKSTFPNRTVDYIWASPRLSAKLVRCRVLFEGQYRTNPVDARSYALSDHLPVMAEFRWP